MSDRSTDPSAVDAEVTQTTSTEYKVVGNLSEETGAAVLGRNQATDTEPVGVEGAVPNADGYGLSTPDDMRVGGTAKLDVLSGPLTGSRSLNALAGDALVVTSKSLSASPARVDVTDGETHLTGVSELSLGSSLHITDEESGTVTIDRE
jgi:hypothetical protein